MLNKLIITLVLTCNIGSQLLAQVNGIYTLPIFEVSQTEVTIIGLREKHADSELHTLSDRKSAFYFNNPFERKKNIVEAKIKFSRVGRRIDAIHVELYSAGLDSFPTDTILFDTLISPSALKRKWLTIKTPPIPCPKNGILIAYTLVTDNNEMLNSDKAGALASKTYNKAHNIRFDYWQGVLNRYPFESMRNDSVIGEYVKEIEKRVPLINLTLVNGE